MTSKDKASVESWPPCAPRGRREEQTWLMLQLKPRHLLIGAFAISGTREHTHILTPYTPKVSRHTHQNSHTLRTKLGTREHTHILTPYTPAHITNIRTKKPKNSIASWVESDFELDSREYSRNLKVTHIHSLWLTYIVRDSHEFVNLAGNIAPPEIWEGRDLMSHISRNLKVTHIHSSWLTYIVRDSHEFVSQQEIFEK